MKITQVETQLGIEQDTTRDLEDILEMRGE